MTNSCFLEAYEMFLRGRCGFSTCWTWFDSMDAISSFCKDMVGVGDEHYWSLMACVDIHFDASWWQWVFGT